MIMGLIMFITPSESKKFACYPVHGNYMVITVLGTIASIASKPLFSLSAYQRTLIAILVNKDKFKNIQIYQSTANKLSSSRWRLTCANEFHQLTMTIIKISDNKGSAEGHCHNNLYYFPIYQFAFPFFYLKLPVLQQTM